MHIRYSKSNLDKLEQIFREMQYSIRYEKGTFTSGYCIVEHRKVIVINRFFDIEGRINVLLDILSNVIVMEDQLSKASITFYKGILRQQEQLIEAS
jgi:hypothetical protein